MELYDPLTRYKKPQKGNPHKLTIRQHIIPRMSIDRFANSNGFVQIYDKMTGKIRLAKSDDDLFIVMRSWDYRTESEFMKDIEDEFQALVSRIILGADLSGELDQLLVTEFFALWQARFWNRKILRNPQKLEYCDGGALIAVNQEQAELYEKMGFLFTDHAGGVSDEYVSGAWIRERMEKGVAFIKSKIEWAVAHVADGELLHPDRMRRFGIMPIKPRLAIISFHGDQKFQAEDTELANKIMMEDADRFCFAKDFSKCPGVNLAFGGR